MEEKIVLKTAKDAFEAIHSVYGNSHEWIKDLATRLQITKNAAQGLVSECGYSRHKLVDEVSFEEFIEMPCAKYLIKKKNLAVS